MDSRNGAWAAFDRDNTRDLLYKMPFSDFGAMIDPPTEDVTAHVLEMMAALGYDTTNRSVARGLAYLRATQKPAGSWYGRWGVNHIYGTWCAISALTALKTGSDMIERAAAWLISMQNTDGGWGESCHSYADESFAGIGRSTPSQTAWAVLGLQLSHSAQHPAVKRGLAYLMQPAAARRHVGRARVHRHWLPRRFLHQLPSLSPPLSDHGTCHAGQTPSC